MHFRKNKKLWILHIKKRNVQRFFHMLFYPLNVFGRVMYSEPLKGYFCIWKILYRLVRERAGK